MSRSRASQVGRPQECSWEWNLGAAISLIVFFVYIVKHSNLGPGGLASLESGMKTGLARQVKPAARACSSPVTLVEIRTLSFNTKGGPGVGMESLQSQLDAPGPHVCPGMTQVR